jgi:hypothetical protein
MKTSIQPIEIIGKGTATQIQFRGVDNFTDVCDLQWEFLNNQDIVLINGNEPIASTDYENWNGNNTYPLQFLQNKLGFQIL